MAYRRMTRAIDWSYMERDLEKIARSRYPRALVTAAEFMLRAIEDMKRDRRSARYSRSYSDRVRDLKMRSDYSPDMIHPDYRDT